MRMMIKTLSPTLVAAAICWLLGPPACNAAAAGLAPADLRCEYQVAPVGIDVTQPRLSWTLGAVADKRELVFTRLLENITQTRNNHISSGIIGTYYVFQTLMEEGRDDVAYAMLTRKDSPGWLHMLNNGATTVWESWNGAGSLNHPALGSIDAWLYRGFGRHPARSGRNRLQARHRQARRRRRPDLGEVLPPVALRQNRQQLAARSRQVASRSHHPAEHQRHGVCANRQIR